MDNGQTKPKIWVIDDDRSIRWVLEKALKAENIEVRSFDEAGPALKALQRQEPDALITDIRMPGMSGLELLSELRAGYPDLPVIIITAHSDLDSAVSAYQGGAFEYLPKPFDIDEAMDLVHRAVSYRHDHASEEVATEPEEEAEIIGEAPSMQEVFRAIGRLSRSNITVLINGESGTGKELVARALHRHSPRADQPFIAINTAAIPRDLLESELFGHERGAFTGAQAARKGRFEQADRGTLFLDEIGDMPAELQTRLLRVLADGEFYRVGGHAPVKVDVRIIAATHQDLETRVREGLFREDLFHRLNVIRIHIPPMRERREDIRLLMQHFLNSAAEELGGEPKRIDKETEAYLSGLDWPGNVRQLENTCRWLTVMSPGQEIHMEDLPAELRQGASTEGSSVEWVASLRRWAERQLAAGGGAILDTALPDFERVMIEAALAKTGGRRQEAAKLLGWGRNTLTRKIKELGMEQRTDAP
ncbi:nitrogen regulation protein NR(I) [Thiohalomonas denitrificans]|uniref:DNA-binding transcriptional regulator NtrC n=1 Tax=Thiohalomonas denitrificans TaxID=415747 RepID=A0A1G5QUD6_9GAMM|nr:nitrogen regulation protein NR(I) [Thiohalomonas denitrificans]SCZ65180.1 two-component system, NtrC family, nitrogen regulation response regulator GlnG [Thiohalomonas denitrificans]